MSPLAIWAVVALLYAGFLGWYYDWKGPLTPAEVDEYVSRMKGLDRSEEELALQRRFLESDDGRDFVMVNIIEFNKEPLRVADAKPGETSAQLMERYMAYLWPALLKRASHPVLAGAAVAPALDVWGVDKAERWSQAGLMRYRSRRDLMEIAANPDFVGAHVYKVAAMHKTIAFPISGYLILGGAPVVLGLFLLAVGGLLHAAFGA